MCLEMVDKKLQAKGYETLKEVVADLGQIFNNAKRCEWACTRAQEVGVSGRD